MGTIIVVGMAVLGSLTALPAALSLLGSWVDRGRIPFLGRRRTAARPSRVWSALVRRVVARPVLLGGAAALALLALAVPALGMRLADPGLRDLPASVPVVQNLMAIQRAFPGGPAPAEVVVTGENLSGPAVRHAVAALQGRAATSGLLREPVTAALLGHGQVLVVSVPLAGDGTDATSVSALATLRDQALPATLGRVHGIGYAVTGMTAGNHDFTPRWTPGADGVRLRARPGVPAADGQLPLGVHPADVDRAEPAVGRRRLRPHDAGLPGRSPARPAGVHPLRGHRALDAAVPVRAPVRAQHGLPRVHPEPDPGTAAAGLVPTRGDHHRASAPARGW